jgi:hypothetical protein
LYPDVNRKWTGGVKLSAAGGVERLQGEAQSAIRIVAFFGMLEIVTALVLLIACANVSSLLLASCCRLYSH